VNLHTAVVKGLKDRAYAAAAERAAAADSLTVINEELIPALNEVGEGFEKGRVFLPQLLMSAEAAKSAFDAIKAHLRSTGAQPVSREPIVLATVKGDIHDIGKNIVRVLLENYGYRVIDLGKDVEPRAIVDAALAEDVKLVGLSALMTTTVPSMEATIALLRKAKPDCKVAVGGAVLTADYAAQIGADFYCKDAMSTVRCAGRLFGYED
jgi:5-methyltetrahydrofolate--homocysteine methyltransferase